MEEMGGSEAGVSGLFLDRRTRIITTRGLPQRLAPIKRCAAGRFGGTLLPDTVVGTHDLDGHCQARSATLRRSPKPRTFRQLAADMRLSAYLCDCMSPPQECDSNVAPRHPCQRRRRRRPRRSGFSRVGGNCWVKSGPKLWPVVRYEGLAPKWRIPHSIFSMLSRRFNCVESTHSRKGRPVFPIAAMGDIFHLAPSTNYRTPR